MLSTKHIFIYYIRRGSSNLHHMQWLKKMILNHDIYILKFKIIK